MLDTKGNTGVYLMFAYCRLKSIMLKSGVDVAALKAAKTEIILEHVCERALAFELLKFSDVLVDVLESLAPNKICEYLYNLCLCATSFVTECRVIGSDEMNSRLVMCSAVVDVMASCFKLLAIDAPDKI
jgi:arginyl-tRNA synthetase